MSFSDALRYIRLQISGNKTCRGHDVTAKKRDKSSGEHCTGIAEAMGSNPVRAWIFSGFNFTAA